MVYELYQIKKREETGSRQRRPQKKTSYIPHNNGAKPHVLTPWGAPQALCFRQSSNSLGYLTPSLRIKPVCHKVLPLKTALPHGGASAAIFVLCDLVNWTTGGTEPKRAHLVLPSGTVALGERQPFVFSSDWN